MKRLLLESLKHFKFKNLFFLFCHPEIRIKVFVWFLVGWLCVPKRKVKTHTLEHSILKISLAICLNSLETILL